MRGANEQSQKNQIEQLMAKADCGLRNKASLFCCGNLLFE